jgi:hypothetical protein
MALAVVGCGRSLERASDGSAGPDAPIDVTASDEPRVTTLTDVPADTAPPSGFIRCGGNFCDPTSTYCYHSISGLTAGNYSCEPYPGRCTGQVGCACLMPDGGATVCSSCLVVTGTDVSGLELDCLGPVG